MNIIPFSRAHDTGEDLVGMLPSEDPRIEVLKEHVSRILSDVAMLVNRPFTLIWDPKIATACTDCKAEIRITPRFFLDGNVEIGYGSIYHECGHIRNSPYGVALLQEAFRKGGETRQNIMMIILDRKDDIKFASDAPGFADILRRRLIHICTMGMREAYEDRLGKLSKEEQYRFLRKVPATDLYQDFFLAAKWHRSPRTPEVARAMKLVKRTRLLKAPPEELQWIAQAIHERLGEMPQMMLNLVIQIDRIDHGGEGDGNAKIDRELGKLLSNLLAQHVASSRKRGIEVVIQMISRHMHANPGPISVGMRENVPLVTVVSNPKFKARYDQLRAAVTEYVEPLVRNLRRLDTPSEFTLYGQDEGDLDLSEAGRIACGLSGFHQETVVERDIDAEVHLAIDTSGSMQGEKIEQAKAIAVVFSEAISALAPACEGRIWSFDSDAVTDYGELSPQSGFVAASCKGGNSDTHMLRIAGTKLAQSKKRRKVLLVLCDDGPDDMQEAKKLAQKLLARGIVVVHLLVGVHGTPDIYPVELMYTSISECLSEFATLLEAVLKNLR